MKLTSSEAGARFQLTEHRLAELRGGEAGAVERVVSVDVGRRHQQVAGYGGAITDSAAMLLGSKLGGQVGLGAAAVRDYFHPHGLNYNMVRVPIGGTDMSWRAYSCADLPPWQLRAAHNHDFQLHSFRLQPEDLEHKLPLLVDILKLRSSELGDGGDGWPLRLIMSSWSAPNWMKSELELVQGQLRGPAGGPYYDAYARYLIKFIDQYEEAIRRGLNSSSFRVWAMTPQNEPRTPSRLGRQVVNYNSNNFSPQQMGQFVSANLVPNLLNSKRPAHDFALFLWDDTLLGLADYQRHLAFEDKPETRAYVRGLAVHWYSQALDKLPYSALYELRRTLPHKYSLLSTEASYIGRPQPGSWPRADRYARDIIQNLRAGSVAWLDWNLALNMEGGPTWSGNFLDAAMLVDERQRVYYKNPMFYAIGHVSRFVRAQSHVLDTQVHRRRNEACDAALASCWQMIDEKEEQTSDLLAVASELDPSDMESRAGLRQIALVLLNRGGESKRIGLDLRGGCRPATGRPNSNQTEEREVLVLQLSARSITSLAFNC